MEANGRLQRWNSKGLWPECLVEAAAKDFSKGWWKLPRGIFGGLGFFKTGKRQAWTPEQERALEANDRLQRWNSRGCDGFKHLKAWKRNRFHTCGGPRRRPCLGVGGYTNKGTWGGTCLNIFPVIGEAIYIGTGGGRTFSESTLIEHFKCSEIDVVTWMCRVFF